MLKNIMRIDFVSFHEKMIALYNSQITTEEYVRDWIKRGMSDIYNREIVVMSEEQFMVVFENGK